MRNAVIVIGLVLNIIGSAVEARGGQESQQLYQVCLVQSAHTERTIERGLCDSAAETAGFAHGVLQPLRCTPGESCVINVCSCVITDPPTVCPDWVNYECRGVGGASR